MKLPGPRCATPARSPQLDQRTPSTLARRRLGKRSIFSVASRSVRRVALTVLIVPTSETARKLTLQDRKARSMAGRRALVSLQSETGTSEMQFVAALDRIPGTRCGNT